MPWLNFARKKADGVGGLAAIPATWLWVSGYSGVHWSIVEYSGTKQSNRNYKEYGYISGDIYGDISHKPNVQLFFIY